MNYDIKCRNDILTGATLIVRIPEHELDMKALLTIEADMPPFIIPFRYISINGEVEFVYQIGLFCKLQYMTGKRDAKEYAQIWTSIITPLYECGDWFMNSHSFLLSAEYLFYDKEKKSVNYVYIPSTRDISNHMQFKELAADVSKMISVDDANFENKVLRTIMKNFEPKELLQMFRATTSENKNSAQTLCAAEKPEDIALPRCEDAAAIDSSDYDPRDIFIDIFANEPRSKKSKKAEKDKAYKKSKKEKKENKAVAGLLSRKKDPALFENMYNRMSGDDMHTSFFERTEPIEYKASSIGVLNSEEVISSVPELTSNKPEIGTDTDSVMVEKSGVQLRYLGNAQLPPVIDINIEVGEIFSIGRYDAAVGRQQSSFEFEKKTKAVSRRHAVIERDAEGYSIIDLASSSGTLINDERLPPNTPYNLQHGDRVSFGSSGANYIWET